FFAYDPSFQGGVRVGAADVDGDGRADLITGTGSGDPLVRVFSGPTGTMLRNFYAFSPSYHGGIFVAGGDTNEGGKADVVVGQAAGGTEVRIIDGVTGQAQRDFFGFDGNFQGGVRLGAVASQGSGRTSIILAAGPGPEPRVRVLDSLTLTEVD